MRIFSILATAAVVFTFASCAETEFNPEETVSINGFEAFKVWAGDRLTERPDKQDMVMTIDGHTVKGTLYDFEQGDGSTIQLFPSEVISKGYVYDKNFFMYFPSDGRPGMIKCDDEGDECTNVATDDGGTIIITRPFKDLDFSK